jgi:hypothetical protein
VYCRSAKRVIFSLDLQHSVLVLLVLQALLLLVPPLALLLELEPLLALRPCCLSVCQ